MEARLFGGLFLFGEPVVFGFGKVFGVLSFDGGGDFFDFGTAAFAIFLAGVDHSK